MSRPYVQWLLRLLLWAMRLLAPSQSGRDATREVWRDVLLVAALLALALLIAGCASLREFANAPIGPEPGSPTVGEAVVSTAASGLALVNPMLAVGAILGGRLLLGTLKRR